MKPRPEKDGAKQVVETADPILANGCCDRELDPEFCISTVYGMGLVVQRCVFCGRPWLFGGYWLGVIDA